MRVTGSVASIFVIKESRPHSYNSSLFQSEYTRGCGLILYMSAHNFIDETGNRYGKLLVVRQAPDKYWGQAQWLCQCDCGEEIIIPGSSLRKRVTKSCGCFRKEVVSKAKRQPHSQAAFNSLFANRRSSAKQRGKDWELTKEQFRQLTKQPCHYCGVEPSQRWKQGYATGDYIWNGLDRQDSNQGYTMNNVVSCCKYCNYAKYTMTVNEFASWVTRVYKHFVVNEQGVFFT